VPLVNVLADDSCRKHGLANTGTAENRAMPTALMLAILVEAECELPAVPEDLAEIDVVANLWFLSTHIHLMLIPFNRPESPQAHAQSKT
jgi:hypothetical protein